MTTTLTCIDAINAHREKLSLEMAALDKVRDHYIDAVENVRQLVSLNESYPDLVDGLWKELESIRGVTSTSTNEASNGHQPQPIEEAEPVPVGTSATILQGMDKKDVQAIASKLKIAHNPKTTKNQLIEKIVARPKEELEKYIMATA